VPSKKDFGPAAIKYGGWFKTCSEYSYVCINDLSKRERGAICVYDCTGEKAVGGRFSALEVETFIKKPAYKRTDKTYHPNITDTINKATNIELNYIAEAQKKNRPVQPYQQEQGTAMEFAELT